jgi:chemotaxis response regulator CheB
MAPGLGPARVLAAVSEEARDRIAAILDGWEIAFAKDRKHALALLESERFDLMIVGAHFDASTALQLLQEVMRRKIACPVVCVRAVSFDSGLGQGAFEAFNAACEELGAHEVMDLLAFPEGPEGNGRIRRMLERLIATHA